jgi:FkbM family methyltransferase
MISNNLKSRLFGSDEFSYITRKNSSYLIQKGNLFLLSPTPKFLGFGIAHFQNRYEKFFTLNKGDTVLDVGACIGDTTISMISTVGNTGYVIAIEPHPDNLRYLKENVKKFSNVKIIEKAVSDNQGKIKLNISAVDITSHSITSKISRGYETVDVGTDTLDNLVGEIPIDFVKINVCSAELAALRGAEKLLNRINKLVICIASQQESIAFSSINQILIEKGFKVKFLPETGDLYAWKKDLVLKKPR